MDRAELVRNAVYVSLTEGCTLTEGISEAGGDEVESSTVDNIGTDSLGIELSDGTRAILKVELLD